MAKLLHEEKIAALAQHLLEAAPDVAFWVGMITNFKLPEVVPQRLRSIPPLEELERWHPPYRGEDILNRIRTHGRTYGQPEPWVAPCLKGRYQEAYAQAHSELALQEVGSTLAVLGEFDAALRVARDPALWRGRQRHILLVLTIEFLRRGHTAESQAILAELELPWKTKPVGTTWAWDRVDLALGFAGREAWGGYPYPDW